MKLSTKLLAAYAVPTAGITSAAAWYYLDDPIVWGHWKETCLRFKVTFVIKSLISAMVRGAYWPHTVLCMVRELGDASVAGPTPPPRSSVITVNGRSCPVVSGLSTGKAVHRNPSPHELIRHDEIG